jgi:hypothetical protein
MIRISLIFGTFVLIAGLLTAAGCSSSSSESAEKIKGMAPGEYREKAEMTREIPASGPAAKGRSRR